MHCWICGNDVDGFLAYGVPEKSGRCPVCGAKPRGRVLGWLLEHVLRLHLPRDARILEAGASGFSVRRLLVPRFVGPNGCTVIDVRKLGHHRRLEHGQRFVQMDLTRMGFLSGCFDLILCNNTLPYVSEDRMALREIRRCLKQDGIAIINTHREPGRTLNVDEHRRRHPALGGDYYAVNGDQWVYGEDFFGRVTDAGLGYRVAGVFSRRPDDFLRRNGLKRRNEVIFAFADPSALKKCRHPDVEFELRTMNPGP